jgi:hypothetical protein
MFTAALTSAIPPQLQHPLNRAGGGWKQQVHVEHCYCPSGAHSVLQLLHQADALGAVCARLIVEGAADDQQQPVLLHHLQRAKAKSANEPIIKSRRSRCH